MTVQRLMTAQEYLDWTDILVEAIDALLTAKGNEDTPGSAAAFAAELRDAITALGDPDEADITIDLLLTVQQLVDAMTLESSVSSMFGAWNSAVSRHLGSDVNDLLDDAGLRVHHYWKRAGNLMILPKNAFPPVTYLGTYAVTGSGTGTLTKVNGGLCSTLYSDAVLEVEVREQTLGVAQIVMTVNGTNFAGQAMSKTATITAEATVGTKFVVGNGTTERFYTITTVTITGGTNGDDLRIQTKEDRAVL